MTTTKSHNRNLLRRGIRAPALARGLSIRLPSHRVLAVLMTLTLCATWVRGQSIGDALASAAVVLLAWALVRELDPDHTMPAQLSGGAVGAFELLHQHQHVDLMAVTVVLLCVRIMLASSGRAVTVVDVALGAGAAWFAADARAGASAAALLIVALLAHSLCSHRWRDRPKESPLTMAAVLVATAAAGIGAVAIGWPLTEGIDPPRWIPVTVLGFLGALVLFIDRTPVASRCDSRDHTGDRAPVTYRRARASRMLFAVALVTVLLADGVGAISATAPLWIASGVAGMYALPRAARSRRYTVADE